MSRIDDDLAMWQEIAKTEYPVEDGIVSVPRRELDALIEMAQHGLTTRIAHRQRVIADLHEILYEMDPEIVTLAIHELGPEKRARLRELLGGSA